MYFVNLLIILNKDRSYIFSGEVKVKWFSFYLMIFWVFRLVFVVSSAFCFSLILLFVSSITLFNGKFHRPSIDLSINLYSCSSLKQFFNGYANYFWTIYGFENFLSQLLDN